MGKTKTQAAERNIEICKSLIDLANIQQSSQGIPPREVKIAFDEVSAPTMAV